MTVVPPLLTVIDAAFMGPLKVYVPVPSTSSAPIGTLLPTALTKLISAEPGYKVKFSMPVVVPFTVLEKLMALLLVVIT